MTRSPDPDKPLRVGLLITELDVGGAERCLTEVALGLDRERFAPHVCALASRPTQERSQLVERLEQAGVPCRFLQADHRRQLIRAWRGVSRWVREARLDVVQSFLFHANVIAGFALGRRGPPLLTGVRVADPRGWRGWLERWASRRAARIVCVSQSVAGFVAARGFAAEQLVVVPNGIALEPRPTAVPLETVGVPAGRRGLVFIGRLDRQKGLDWLLDVGERLFAAAPEHNLVLVGDGPLRSELARRIARAPLQGRVHLAGWRPDAVQLLAAADLLLLPSRYEGMPNVILEAMRSGLPVVATRAEGVSELLGEGADAQTVAFGDSDALIERVRLAAGDTQWRRQWGDFNRRRVEQHYSLEKMLERYERLFLEAAGRAADA